MRRGTHHSDTITLPAEERSHYHGPTVSTWSRYAGAGLLNAGLQNERAKYREKNEHSRERAAFCWRVARDRLDSFVQPGRRNRRVMNVPAPLTAICFNCQYLEELDCD